VSIIAISPNGPSQAATNPSHDSHQQHRVVVGGIVTNGAIDPNTWTYDVGGSGWGNGQLNTTPPSTRILT